MLDILIELLNLVVIKNTITLRPIENVRGSNFS